MDKIDLKLLGQLQSQFPLTPRPFTEIARKMEIDTDEVIGRILKLKDQGIVRQISPILDARKLGYQSTLIAIKVPDARIDRARQVINNHPGISHGYRRNHDFNIWITLSIPRSHNVEVEMEKLASAIGTDTIITLPALKIFKLRAYFGGNEDDAPELNPNTRPDVTSRASELSTMDQATINEFQYDLPVEVQPFSSLASKLGIDVSTLLAEYKSLLDRGIMRRFGAAVNHRRAGYQANAMACWDVPPEKLDSTAHKLAALPEVSHCYERKTGPLWTYNLFAMVHARTREDCLKTVDTISEVTGQTEKVVLFSTEEIKKTRIKYPVYIGIDKEI